MPAGFSVAVCFPFLQNPATNLDALKKYKMVWIISIMPLADQVREI